MFLDYATMSRVRLCQQKSEHTVSITAQNNCNIQQILKETQSPPWLIQQIARTQLPSEGGVRRVSASSPTMNIFGQLLLQ